MSMPLILQSDRSECAVACLAMVAGFHGHRATLSELRARFRISERGTTLAGLRDYAEQLGFKCRGVRAELDELGQLRAPAILHWDLDHFVVLQKVGRGRVTVLDPAVGQRRLRMSDVDSRFTGVALELVPTLGLVRRKPGATVGLWDFVPVFRGLGGALATVCVLTVALQAFALVMPLNMQLAVDNGDVPFQNESLAQLTSTSTTRGPASRRSVTERQSLRKKRSRSATDTLSPYPAPLSCHWPLFQAVAENVVFVIVFRRDPYDSSPMGWPAASFPWV